MKKNGWRGFGFATLYVIFFLFMQFMISFIVSFIYLIKELSVGMDRLNYAYIMRELPLGEMTMLSLGLSSILTVLAVFLFYLLIIKQKPARMLELNKISPITAVLSAVSGAALLFLCDSVLNLLPIPDSMFQQYYEAFELINMQPTWQIVLVVGILGPICEEVIFRGGVMNCLRKDSNAYIAIVISGLVFGAIHGIALQVAYAAVIGIILGVVFHCTKSLYTTIIIHIVNNILSSVLPSELLTDMNIGLLITIIVISSAVLGVCIWLMKKIEKDRQYSSINPTGAKPINQIQPPQI